MKVLLKVFLLVLLSGTSSILSAQNNATVVTREFRFIEQSGSVYAPAAKQRIKLKFTNRPHLTLTAYTDSQGVVKFKSRRCKNTDYDGEIILNSPSTKSILRIPIDLVCGTEDAYPEGYVYGTYSMNDGKLISSGVFAKDFPCPKCKELR